MSHRKRPVNEKHKAGIQHYGQTSCILLATYKLSLKLKALSIMATEVKSRMFRVIKQGRNTKTIKNKNKQSDVFC